MERNNEREGERTIGRDYVSKLEFRGFLEFPPHLDCASQWVVLLDH